MNHLLFCIAAISALLLGLNAGAHAEILPSSVHLQVYGTHQANDIIYHYKLINNSDETLQHFVIGSIYSTEDKGEYPQLERLPTGWSYGKTGETGTEILLASTSTSQPPYWTSLVYGQEEIDYYYLEWETTPDGQTYAIPPGQSLAGFSVSVPLFDPNEFPPDYYNAGVSAPGWKENDIYLTGSFKVSYWDSNKNELKNVWGPIEIVDTTPPALTVALSPSKLWPPNGKMMPVTATITVKDDYDPNPVVKLLSITCNEPMDKDDIQGAQPYTDVRQFKLKAGREGKSKTGRTYTVSYFANDASGNQTVASATVTVPHDEKEHEGRRDNNGPHEKHDSKDDKKDSWGTMLQPFPKQK